MKLAVFNLWLCSVLVVVHSFDPKKVDYCKNPCQIFGEQVEHTACSKCPLKKQRTEVLDALVDFREKMVRLHNEYRNKIAKGDEEGVYGFPSAANMMAVNYDLEMEYIARCYARQVTNNHDKCRKPQGYDHAGQNMYFATNKDLDADPVQSWYDEIKLVGGPKSKEDFLSKFVFDSNTGHFTQIIWATVTIIGCARVWAENVGYHFIIICNYAGKEGSGNMRDAKIYEIGTPCSKCPQGCNKDYPALCGEIKKVSDIDPYKDVGKDKDVDKGGNASAGSVGINNHKILLNNQIFIFLLVAVTLTNSKMRGN